MQRTILGAMLAVLAVALLTALALVASAAPLRAQVVLAGERVRVVTHGDPVSRVSRVVRLRGDTLWLERPAARGTRPDTTFAIPLVDVRRLERSVGERRHVGRNAWLGAAVGSALGVVTGLAAGAADGVAAEAAVGLGTMFALPGAGVGALTGMRRTEGWEPVSLAARAATDRGPSPSDVFRLKPRLRPTRVPRQGGTWARGFEAGLTVRGW